MSVVRLPDAAGNTLKVIEYKGFYYPFSDVDVVKGISSINIRDDDIFIIAYPKCGTHWVWEMARLLLAGTTDLEPVEKDDFMIEFIPNEVLEKFPSPRILNCHILLEHLPRAFQEKKCKIVFITRNPKDMAVSFYHHTKNLREYYEYDGSWSDYLPMLMEGKVDYESYFKFLKSWGKVQKDHPDWPIQNLAYEDLKEDAGRGIRQLAKFFGVERSEEFYTKVQELTSFSSMKAAKGHIIKANDGGPVMYRKGEVGDWKNHFTVAQNERFDKLCKEELSNLDIKFRYTIR